jgi:hypothetical protein
MLLNLGLNNDKCIHTLPLLSDPFHTSPSLSLPLQTFRLVSLVSLIAKTKRIAERSDTNCDTHTQSHTDRQSTQGKYMINGFLATSPCQHVVSLPQSSCVSPVNLTDGRGGGGGGRSQIIQRRESLAFCNTLNTL